MTRTIIKSGTVVSAEKVWQADVASRTRLSPRSLTPSNPGRMTAIDASGLLVLPGIIDAHTHIQLYGHLPDPTTG